MSAFSKCSPSHQPHRHSTGHRRMVRQTSQIATCRPCRGRRPFQVLRLSRIIAAVSAWEAELPDPIVPSGATHGSIASGTESAEALHRALLQPSEASQGNVRTGPTPQLMPTAIRCARDSIPENASTIQAVAAQLARLSGWMPTATKSAEVISADAKHARTFRPTLLVPIRHIRPGGRGGIGRRDGGLPSLVQN